MVRFFVLGIAFLFSVNELFSQDTAADNGHLLKQIGIRTKINSYKGYFTLNPFMVFSSTDKKYWRGGIYYEHANYEQEFSFQPTGFFVTQDLIGINAAYTRVLKRNAKNNFLISAFLEGLVYHQSTGFENVNYGPINIDGFFARLGIGASYIINKITLGIEGDLGWGYGYETKANEEKPGSFYFFHVDRRGSLLDLGVYFSVAYKLEQH